MSLAEMMLALLILLIVTSIMTNGMSTVQNVYKTLITGANAQVVLTTAINSLRNELDTAREVTVNGNEITYFNYAIGAYSRISLDEKNRNNIIVEPYLKWDEKNEKYVSIDKSIPPAPLVSNEAADGVLYVTYDSVTYQRPDMITFENLRVCNGGIDLVSIKDTENGGFSIKIITPSEADAIEPEDTDPGTEGGDNP